ncbi:Type II secretory pathway, component PulF [Hathewaya proteolytica DSM 3090]|uniref:Type II secretory pathway, component PulF n=1 Tax=Hathewaya proteolytica DSM 3090 TaxID=1121331 RepID=A0A1M6L618_9CLOT|nr:type II secretion system F family protein [Hathewaya proteolytica]SHJ66651.1 Type II secretory pathway, component PulF [Hathewaya proteolytica DSM 3090]
MKELKIDEIIRLNRNMYMYLKCGYNLPKVLEMMINRKLCKGRTLKAVKSIKANMDKGYSMGESFEKSLYFPQYVIQLIKIGEESGQLCSVLKSLVEYYEEKKKRNKSLWATLAYPLFVVVLGILLFLGVVLYFAPMMNNSLSSCNIDNNKYMNSLLTINQWIRKYWRYVISVIMFIFFIFIVCYFKFKRGLYFIMNKVLLVKWVYHSVCSMKYTYFMYVLLDNGVHINNCLEIMMKNEKDSILKHKILRGLKYIKSGEPFHRALSSMEIFPCIAIDIICVGEDTAQLEQSLYNSYKIQKDRFNESFKKAINILQPALIILLGIMIFFLIYSVMCPVMESMGNLK